MHHLIVVYGYWAVFAMVALESLGVPLPGETTVIAASVYAGHTHRLSVWAIFAAAASAAVIGDNLGFWIGQKAGCRLLRRDSARRRVSEAKLKTGRYLFDRHGGKLVFFGRFVSVLRTYAALLAGMNGMRWERFTFYNASGGLVWAGVFSFASYQAGSTVRHVSGTVSVILAATAVASIAAAAVVAHRRADLIAAKAAAAYPEPIGCE